MKLNRWFLISSTAFLALVHSAGAYDDTIVRISAYNAEIGALEKAEGKAVRRAERFDRKAQKARAKCNYKREDKLIRKMRAADREGSLYQHQIDRLESERNQLTRPVVISSTSNSNSNHEHYPDVIYDAEGNEHGILMAVHGYPTGGSNYPGQYPGKVPGKGPGQYPGKDPNPYPGKLPNDLPNDLPNSGRKEEVVIVEKTPSSKKGPNQYPTQYPNQYPNDLPNNLPNSDTQEEEVIIVEENRPVQTPVQTPVKPAVNARGKESNQPKPAVNARANENNKAPEPVKEPVKEEVAKKEEPAKTEPAKEPAKVDDCGFEVVRDSWIGHGRFGRSVGKTKIKLRDCNGEKTKLKPKMKSTDADILAMLDEYMNSPSSRFKDPAVADKAVKAIFEKRGQPEKYAEWVARQKKDANTAANAQ